MVEIETELINSCNALWDESSDWLYGGWVLSGLMVACGVEGIATVTFKTLTAILAGDAIGRVASLGDFTWSTIFTYCALSMAHMLPFPFGFLMGALYVVRLTLHVLQQNVHTLTNRPSERLDDVVPLGKAKEKIAELAIYLRDPEPFVRIGAKPPRGVLLIGPSGTGKTLLAKALSNEIGPYTSFIQTTGSQLKSKWVGESAERVRDIFEEAKENARREQERLERDLIDDPTLADYRGYCVIFIDEIDSFGSRKSSGIGSETAHRDAVDTINEMLAQMDGFNPSDSILVIGTTNDADRLDPALLSRFPSRIKTELPTKEERRQIFEKHLRDARVLEGLNLDQLAAKTAGLSGRDIKFITERALWNAAIKRALGIDQDELVRAIEEFTADQPLSLDILDKGLAFS